MGTAKRPLRWWLPVAGVLVIVAAGGLVWLARYAAAAGVAEEAARRDLAQHPLLVEALGRVDRLQVDFGRSLGGARHLWVYEVNGADGSGRLTVQHAENVDGTLVVRWASLEKPDGEVIHVVTED